MYAQVVFSIASFKSFTYCIPKKIQSNISAGSAVYAPFKNQLHIGYVVSTNTTSAYKGKIHSIDSLYDGRPPIPKELWKTIIWVSKYYITPIGIVLKAAIHN